MRRCVVECIERDSVALHACRANGLLIIIGLKMFAGQQRGSSRREARTNNYGIWYVLYMYL
jgi:hypothetical protein